MNKESITIAELAEKADEYLHEASLPPDEYEAVKRGVAELAPIFGTDRAYFVLGSYLKFRILADYADYLFGVVEHSRGGFLVEQGYFTALETVSRNTYLPLGPYS